MFLSDSSTADLTALSPMQTEHKRTFYGHCLVLTYPTYVNPFFSQCFFYFPFCSTGG